MYKNIYLYTGSYVAEWSLKNLLSSCESVEITTAKNIKINMAYDIETELCYILDGSEDIFIPYNVNAVQVKSYTVEEVKNIINASLDTVFSSNTKQHVPGFEESIVKYVDYMFVLLYLKNNGYAVISNSEFCMSSSGIKFVLLDNVKELCGSLVEYIGLEYEVDFLGTSLCKKLSAGVEELCVLLMLQR